VPARDRASQCVSLNQDSGTARKTYTPPRMSKRAALPLTVAIAGCLASTSARADDGPYQVDWTVDLAVLAGSAALWIVPPVVQREVIVPSCPCSSAMVNGFDRGAIHARRAAAGDASNVLAVASLALPVALDAVDVWMNGSAWSGFARDLVVMAEAVVLNGATGQVVKLAVRRPRPYVYELAAGAPDLATAESYLSFYSAHTSGALAAGLSYATTFALRHPDSDWRWWVYGGAAALGGTMAVLRVAAGQHFPSDVITGAAVGAAFGLVVPRLHRRVVPMAVPAGAGLALAGNF
jgi:membrane-associated phospholipid phosphatase